MISILATVDGSPESRAVIPALEKMAAGMGARTTLLEVIERPRATLRREEAWRAPLVRAAGVPRGTAIRLARERRYAESDDQALQRAYSEAHDFLEETAEPLRRRGMEVSTDVVIKDDVAGAIVDFAREHEVDLIAMATHGRSGLNKLVQGSVTSAVVRSGVAPVLVVQPTRS